MRRVLAIAVAAAALAVPAQANAADCITYPGDAAPKQAIAAWMAYGAAVRGVPAELPVMAALVESGVSNLSSGSADSVGFFAMRMGIWNQGEYAGYPTNPPLQLDWFLDQALALLAARRPTDPGYGASEQRYGEWAADILRPAQQFRDRYQLRLDEAETCAASAEARISLPGAARTYRVSSRPRNLAAGTPERLTLHFGRGLRAALGRHKRRGRHARAALTITAADAAGNSTSEQRRVRIF